MPSSDPPEASSRRASSAPSGRASPASSGRASPASSGRASPTYSSRSSHSRNPDIVNTGGSRAPDQPESSKGKSKAKGSAHKQIRNKPRLTKSGRGNWDDSDEGGSGDAGSSSGDVSETFSGQKRDSEVLQNDEDESETQGASPDLLEINSEGSGNERSDGHPSTSGSARGENRYIDGLTHKHSEQRDRSQRFEPSARKGKSNEGTPEERPAAGGRRPSDFCRLGQRKKTGRRDGGEDARVDLNQLPVNELWPTFCSMVDFPTRAALIGIMLEEDKTNVSSLLLSLSQGRNAANNCSGKSDSQKGNDEKGGAERGFVSKAFVYFSHAMIGKEASAFSSGEKIATPVNNAFFAVAQEMWVGGMGKFRESLTSARSTLHAHVRKSVVSLVLIPLAQSVMNTNPGITSDARLYRVARNTLKDFTIKSQGMEDFFESMASNSLHNHRAKSREISLGDIFGKGNGDGETFTDKVTIPIACAALYDIQNVKLATAPTNETISDMFNKARDWQVLKKGGNKGDSASGSFQEELWDGLFRFSTGEKSCPAYDLAHMKKEDLKGLEGRHFIQPYLYEPEDNDTGERDSSPADVSHTAAAAGSQGVEGASQGVEGASQGVEGASQGVEGASQGVEGGGFVPETNPQGSDINTERM